MKKLKLMMVVLVTMTMTTGCYIQGSMFPVRDSVNSANKVPVVVPNVQVKNLNS